MALRINQNIAAMQGHYYLAVNEANFNKSIERLSSGLRINRASDDPAGLVISEKYRAEIEGLQQAVNNSKDGIGMIQTAEGALDEMGSLLRSMRNLALHAANTGANDTDAIQADQDQIKSEIDSLNRIARNTKFGTKTLLNGSLGVDGTPASSNVTFVSGTTDTKAGNYAVSISQAATQGYVKTGALAFVSYNHAGGASASSTLAAAATLTFSGELFQYATGGPGTPYSLAIASGNSLSGIVAAINSDSTLSALGITASLVGTATVVMKSDRLGTFTITSSGATLANISGFTTTGESATTTAVSSTNYANIKFAQDETIQFKDLKTGNVASISITAGTTIAGAMDTITTELTNNSINVSVSLSGAQLQFKNGTYGDENVAQTEILHTNTANSANANFGFATNTWAFIADGADTGMGGDYGRNVVGTIDGNSATGSGQLLTSYIGDSKGLKLRIAGDTTGDLSTVAVTKGSITFQIGAFEGQTVSTLIGNLVSSRLGISANSTTANISLIDVAADSTDAVTVIDAAISELSTIRSTLGSFQKDVLESTVRNLGIAQTNMASSESLIRDADMAKEMLNFSRAQILQQTGVAMLAQANTAPNLILNLFRV